MKAKEIILKWTTIKSKFSDKQSLGRNVRTYKAPDIPDFNYGMTTGRFTSGVHQPQTIPRSMMQVHDLFTVVIHGCGTEAVERTTSIAGGGDKYFYCQQCKDEVDPANPMLNIGEEFFMHIPESISIPGLPPAPQKHPPNLTSKGSLPPTWLTDVAQFGNRDIHPSNSELISYLQNIVGYWQAEGLRRIRSRNMIESFLHTLANGNLMRSNPQYNGRRCDIDDIFDMLKLNRPKP